MIMTTIGDGWCRMQETGIKLLWGTANLFSNPRYMNGAATNPGRSADALPTPSSKLLVLTHENDTRCQRVCLCCSTGEEVSGHLQGARC